MFLGVVAKVVNTIVCYLNFPKIKYIRIFNCNYFIPLLVLDTIIESFFLELSF